jgi:hypothetical protein
MYTARHIPALACCAALFAVAGCQRDDEAQMRARLAPMFALGDTLAFSARARCAMGAFRLVHDRVGSGLPVEDSVQAWVRALGQRGRGALDLPGLSPDAAMVAVANTDRPLGMAMRGRSIEARDCMDDRIKTEFTRLLRADGIVIGFDAAEGAVMLMDRRNAVLLVVVGERP